MKKLINTQGLHSVIYLYESGGGGGVWHYMYTDQWGNDNFQCQPVAQNPNCWPVWAWYTTPQ